jgi:replicative DNA helicase
VSQPHPFLEHWDHGAPPDPKVRRLPLTPADPHATALEAATVPTPDELVPWPWDAVHRIAGPLAPGSLTLVSARTGSGKTLFIRNWLHWLATHSGDDGPSVAYFPTETPVREVLRGITCAELGVDPVRIARGDFSHVEGGSDGFFAATQATAKRLLARRGELRGAPLMLFQSPRPSLALVRESLSRAKQDGCTVAVIDHILRLDLGDGTQLFSEVTAAARGLKMLAEELQMAVVATSQQGRAAFAGDRLAAFAPPDLSALKGAGTLEEEADLVLFLHRLLRDDLAKEQIADVRAGRIPLQEAVAPHLMGVAVGKHRLDGGKTGAQERVWVEHGRVSDLPDIERRTWEAHRNAIRTGGAL